MNNIRWSTRRRRRGAGPGGGRHRGGSRHGGSRLGRIARLDVGGVIFLARGRPGRVFGGSVASISWMLAVGSLGSGRRSVLARLMRLKRSVVGRLIVAPLSSVARGRPGHDSGGSEASGIPVAVRPRGGERSAIVTGRRVGTSGSRRTGASENNGRLVQYGVLFL